jgi:hypothetical protein
MKFKQLLNAVPHFIVITFFSGLCNPMFYIAFYGAGMGAMGMSLWN